MDSMAHGMDMMGGMDMMSGMGGAMWIGMILYGLLVAALIALAVAATLRLLRGRPTTPSTATGELDLRYARGELDRDEYLQRRADLADGR